MPTGGWFGEGSLLKHPGEAHADVVAVRDRAWPICRAHLHAPVDTHIAFNRFLLKQLNERLAKFIAIVENDRMLEPDARAVRWGNCSTRCSIPAPPPSCSSRRRKSASCLACRASANQALQVLERLAGGIWR